MSNPEEFIPPSIEEIAALLPAYEINSFIAKGGMGAVYMARQRSLDRMVAIKILPRKFGEDQMFRESFEQEAKSMAKFNHPNLISIYDFGQIDGMLYFIMEMVQGKPLYYSCYGKKIDPTESNRIIVEICSGLHHAHKHGILHRDIKPANILLDPNITPKIGDFGLARGVEDHASDQAFGTPGYTAPEVVNNPTAVRECTDIYSVGIMLYELLTSKLPETPYIPVTSVIKCDPQYDQIILKAIHPNPSMRYQSAQEMSEALIKIVKPSLNSPFVDTRSVKSPNMTTASPIATSPFSSTKIASTKPASELLANQVGNSSLTRNIVIILLLCGLIVAAWQGLKIAEKKRETENLKVLKHNKETKQENARKFAESRNPDLANSGKSNVDTSSTTPLASLEALKTQLQKGSRVQMPKGTVSRNGRSRFYIEEPMTWYEANSFAEDYGAHLAVSPTPEDLTSLSSKINSSDSIWLGAGSSGDRNWQWIDGSPWTHSVRKSSRLLFLTVNKFGILSPTDPNEKHSFYIEWLDSGKTPASLINQLKRTSKSLKSKKPEYPAGTISYDGKYYLLISKNISWSRAADLAKLSGGHLAVPSDTLENDWLLEFVTSMIGEQEACWIGGICKDGSTWEWVTDEPWIFATWDGDKTNADSSSNFACAISNKNSWVDFKVKDSLPCTLIEWSDDRGGNTGGGANNRSTQMPEKVAKLKTKCVELIQDIIDKNENKFLNNSKGLLNELKSYQAGLSSQTRQVYTPIIEELTAKTSEKRLRSNVKNDMPKDLADIFKTRLKKQNKGEIAVLAEIEGIKNLYIKKLEEIANEYRASGQKDLLLITEREIKNSNVNSKKFSKYILK